MLLNESNDLNDLNDQIIDSCKDVMKIEKQEGLMMMNKEILNEMGMGIMW